MALNTFYKLKTLKYKYIFSSDLSPNLQTCTSSHLFEITTWVTDRYLKLNMSQTETLFPFALEINRNTIITGAQANNHGVVLLFFSHSTVCQQILFTLDI